MKNLIRGVLLGLALGAALHWLGTMPGYFPSVLAVVVLVAMLIPMERQERYLQGIHTGIEEIRKRLDDLELDEPQPFRPQVSARELAMDEPFIPTIQSGATENKPATATKKRTVDRSLNEMAKKLAAMQGG